MAVKKRCIRCGNAFAPDNWEACGTDFCPSCREKPQKAVISAEKETYRACRDAGMSEGTAAQKAHETAQEVERIRRRKGR